MLRGNNTKYHGRIHKTRYWTQRVITVEARAPRLLPAAPCTGDVNNITQQFMSRLQLAGYLSLYYFYLGLSIVLRLFKDKNQVHHEIVVNIIIIYEA